VTTVGGVLRAGEELMQIIPVNDRLIIESKVHPVDIGLEATIRFDSFDYTLFGGVMGEVV
jgi:adhesin transport system membrane fusion protein